MLRFLIMTAVLLGVSIGVSACGKDVSVFPPDPYGGGGGLHSPTHHPVTNQHP